MTTYDGPGGGDLPGPLGPALARVSLTRPRLAPVKTRGSLESAGVVTGLPGRQRVAAAEVRRGPGVVLTSWVSSAHLTQLLEAVARVLWRLCLHLRLVMRVMRPGAGAGTGLPLDVTREQGGVGQGVRGGGVAEAEVLRPLLKLIRDRPRVVIRLQLRQTGAH